MQKCCATDWRAPKAPPQFLILNSKFLIHSDGEGAPTQLPEEPRNPRNSEEPRNSLPDIFQMMLAHDDSLDSLPLDGFPVIDDFYVTLAEEGEGGLHVEFRSQKHGRLAGFPAWDHADRDLRHFTPSDVPLGTIVTPYDDRDEGWRILIFGEAGWIHVLEGDSPNAEEFPRFFRVKAGRYVQAWAAVIDAYNPITPLDETEN